MRELARPVVLAFVFAAASGSGCTTAVYHPLTGFQRPVALEPRAGTFTGLRLEITCLPSDTLERGDMERLCRHARKLFADQGAAVETSTRMAGGLEVAGLPRPSAEPLLKVNLSGRSSRTEPGFLGTFIGVYTLTLVPIVAETLFVQDVVVRDESGFLLASDTWQGRIVEYTGVGYWALNYTLDHTVRPPEAAITGDAGSRDFSRDFDRQLTQIVYNARGRWRVLQQNSAAPPAKPLDSPKSVN